MQRHHALRGLSNQHFRGLALARRARKAVTLETSAQVGGLGGYSKNLSN